MRSQPFLFDFFLNAILKIAIHDAKSVNSWRSIANSRRFGDNSPGLTQPLYGFTLVAHLTEKTVSVILIDVAWQRLSSL